MESSSSPPSSSSSMATTSWWLLAQLAVMETECLSNYIIVSAIILALVSLFLLTWAFSSGGFTWRNGRNHRSTVPIPGPRGLPIFGSLLSLNSGLAHRTLAGMAKSLGATRLMVFSLGSTPVVVTCDSQIAREILMSPDFANRPIKASARHLMFTRAIGFAPNGTYWRLLRRIASTHLFAPKRIAAHEPRRQLDCDALLGSIKKEQSANGCVVLRRHLQVAALQNIMGTVFGKRYGSLDVSGEDYKELQEMVREGFDLLGAFNWSDYLPWLSFFYDPNRTSERCSALVPRVRRFVKNIIDEHELRRPEELSDNSDFVDVLLALEGDEKLSEEDMVAVLWEMIFRGTDTTALLTEWVLAELVLNPNVQSKLYDELNCITGTTGCTVTDTDVANSPYIQAVVKETLRLHPPGPLLSWARLSTSDVQLSNGMVVPANTTAMVNMWAITHDQKEWENPLEFRPERFVKSEGGMDMDCRGGDLRLAPFGAGRRVCPGRNLGLATVSLWVAKLVYHCKWVEDEANPVDLSEVLKLSCEMKSPLYALALPRDSSPLN